MKLIFNPFTGNFEYITVAPSKGELVKSLLLEKFEDGINSSLTLLFDEDSILYEDDEFNA